MSDPIIVIDTSSIREGKLQEVEAAADGLVTFVEANEPDILFYEVCIDREVGQMTVVQIHPSSESMELHMDLAAPVFRGFSGLVELSRVDFYGSPSAAVLDQMRRKAEMLGGAPVVVNQRHAGFARPLGEEALDLARASGSSPLVPRPDASSSGS